MAETEEELKSFLMRVNEESEKSCLKLNIQKNENHGTRSHHFMANRWGKSWNSDRFYFLGLQNHFGWWLQSWIKICLLLGRKAMTNLNKVLKSQRYHFATKVQIVKDMVLLVVLYKEGWVSTKELIFWTVVLEKALESPLDCKEIKPVSYKGNQPWIFTGRANAEAPILWPPDA